MEFVGDLVFNWWPWHNGQIETPLRDFWVGHSPRRFMLKTPVTLRLKDESMRVLPVTIITWLSEHIREDTHVSSHLTAKGHINNQSTPELELYQPGTLLGSLPNRSFCSLCLGPSVPDLPLSLLPSKPAFCPHFRDCLILDQPVWKMKDVFTCHRVALGYSRILPFKVHCQIFTIQSSLIKRNIWCLKSTPEHRLVCLQANTVTITIMSYCTCTLLHAKSTLELKAGEGNMTHVSRFSYAGRLVTWKAALEQLGNRVSGCLNRPQRDALSFPAGKADQSRFSSPRSQRGNGNVGAPVKDGADGGVSRAEWSVTTECSFSPKKNHKSSHPHISTEKELHSVFSLCLPGPSSPVGHRLLISTVVFQAWSIRSC